jgi:hypothetical protein
MRLVDADALDDLICQLNEEGHEITRNEYKMIDNILFELPTVDVLDKIRAEIKELSYPYNIDAMRTKSDVLQIIDKYMKGE